MKIIRSKSKMCQSKRLIKFCDVIIIKNCVYVTFIVFMITMCFFLNMMIKESEEVFGDPVMRLPTDLKYILFWRKDKDLVNEIYSKYRYKLSEGQTLFINQKCKYINCYITYDKNLLRHNPKNFDAVVFNVKEIDNVKQKYLNLPRSNHQLYIFNSMDSAELFPVCLPVYDNFFNLTWTYRLDSDIPNAFFDIYDTNKTLIGPKSKMDWLDNIKHTKEYRNITRKKTKAVAWIVNKCRSIKKHNQLIMDLVEELAAYNHSLDIFGHCGATKCPNNDTLNCYKIIERDYYFNLVLEDSVATGHITERMALAMMHYSIPLVDGGKEYESYLPPGSYIKIRNQTLKELGAIIDYLIRHPEVYEYFFDWKQYYSYKVKPKDSVCNLCEYLNTNKAKHKIGGLRVWWNPFYFVECHQKKMFDMFNINYD
ncbi:PREDICTED: alpha-(1,3)-fucosyltransferase C-like [Papilio polytes]|uniref:alpha-(1,3)-fucosyltransferase C-like n=1 Tax=Papilio polytes TaxID=76194 RepID=UPI0006764C02|nr:PREDICTED: alpha-(1,3)-fucosyltransferase C-like [Papilio polytes]